MCTFANWAGLTLYLLEIFRNCLHPVYNRQPDILTSLCKYAPSAKDIAMAILHRWRIIKHSVRNNSAKHERATASLDLDLPLQFIFAVFLSVRCGFESVSRGRIRGHIKSHILNLCLSCFYSARIGIIYDFVRGDHLDKDERGSDEENMTDICSESSLFFPFPDCSQAREERIHPSFKLLSPSISRPVSLIRPPGLYLVHFYATLRLQPLLSPLVSPGSIFPDSSKFGPQMIKRKKKKKNPTTLMSSFHSSAWPCSL